MSDETRQLQQDERALFDWFFTESSVLAGLLPLLALDVPADVFALDSDGYRTMSVPYVRGAIPPDLPSPYGLEARAAVENHPFEALFFLGNDGVMMELIWSAGTWPGRLPRADELEPHYRQSRL